MKSILFVFLGGGIGSLLRYGINNLMASFSEKFPFGTLLVNVLACLLLGFLIGLSAKNLFSQEMKLFLLVGVCGGFSTFSTFSAESFQLFDSGQALSAILYMAASFLICLLAIYGGMTVAEQL
ncbi:fluoride efflux transporter CrcB [Portibacter lacus]|uniref:Fluoride-specific ion channel FluC n=1 Tax=Portibacter lacus TaxID=1099794 RepID=A0AA37WHD4_9BACT|nr:fluoride efflux transporter CrcB [Portibacter lacus]GLR18630.1 putative fluoride ion transporter CrcB [Portibacter lacus]